MRTPFVPRSQDVLFVTTIGIKALGVLFEFVSRSPIAIVGGGSAVVATVKGFTLLRFLNPLVVGFSIPLTSAQLILLSKFGLGFSIPLD